MNEVRTVSVLILGWIGAIFVLLGAVGVLRMPDVFSRLQTSSKAVTLGVIGLLSAVVVYFGEGAITFQAAILAVFLFITAPIAAHLTARAAFVTHAKLDDETVVNEAAQLENQGAASDSEAPEEPALLTPTSFPETFPAAQDRSS